MSLLQIIVILASATVVLSWYPSAYEVPGDQSYHGVHDGLEHVKSFEDEWMVHVEGGDEVAELVALELGYVYGGPVLGFPNTYTFIKFGHSKHRRTPSTHTSTLVKDRRFILNNSRSKARAIVGALTGHYATGTIKLTLDPGCRACGEEEETMEHLYCVTAMSWWENVRWAEQLFTKSRVKRYPPVVDKEVHRVKRIEVTKQRNDTTIADREREKRNVVRRTKPLFNDELWGHEWYLQDTRTIRSLPRLDLNVLPAYKMGYNGRGVRVSVLDDGIEHNHTDLRENYDPEISWDCNDRDFDPSPRYEKIMRNSHGTRCAGEIAMTANNGKCGVGVAWGAKVGGVRMLDGRITDRIEGEAIGYAWNKVDVYSASWGPNDDGSTVEGPGRLAIEAFKRGIAEGRGGKGTIYVWANGNGGGHNDNCNCDGYSSSIYTISIGSASQHGLFPWYGEICSSTLAVAYSSGAYKDQKIATTDTSDSCTLGHTGTSAAAPLAAGIIALALQANPHLTWRDVQHLIVWTSEYGALSANSGWQKNGVGLRFDTRFGFGLINAGALVSAALNWTTVPDKHECRIEATPSGAREGRITSKEPIVIAIKVEDCLVNYIEHVELIINVRYTRRGALEIQMRSPQGTNVQLLSGRPRDQSKAGFVNWPLMSVATWGEKSNGVWTITFEDKTNEINSGEVGKISLVIHGTSIQPAHMKNAPKKHDYDSFYDETLRYFDNLNVFGEDGGFEPETVPETVRDEEERRGELDWEGEKGIGRTQVDGGRDSVGIIQPGGKLGWGWSREPGGSFVSNINSGIGAAGATTEQEFLKNMEPKILDAVEKVLQRIRHRKYHT